MIHDATIPGSVTVYFDATRRLYLTKSLRAVDSVGGVIYYRIRARIFGKTKVLRLVATKQETGGDK